MANRLFALLGTACAMSACGGEVGGVTSSTNPSGSSVGGGNGGSSGNDILFASGGSTNGSGNTGNTVGTLGRSGTGGSSGAGGEGGARSASGAPGTGGNGPCLPENVCTPTACGSLVDACGNVVDCGFTNCDQSICGSPDPNTSIATPNVCPPCTKTDCATAGTNCGAIPDGCGGVIDCGTCTAPECCGCAPTGSTGVPNVCGGSIYSGTMMPSTCIAGTKGCLCDSKGGCASGLTCNTTRNPNICCNGTDCTLSTSVPNVATCSGTGVARCAPGVTIPAATAATDNCGYSVTSFNESAFICGVNATGGGSAPTRIQGFFNDEWPLTLGCATTTYPASPMTTSTLGGLMYPQLGDPTCNDVNGRPMRPTLFITDITADPNCKAGDQQAGSVSYDPIGVFGTWTYADSTGTPVRQSDIPMNYWTLGTGADPVPPSVSNQCPCTPQSCPGSGFTGKGYGAEVLYEVALISGHSYRFQFMAHDGDQSQSGDSGETCINFCAGSGPCTPKTCEQICPAPAGGIAPCAAVYDPAIYALECPKSDGCAGVLTCYCPTG